MASNELIGNSLHINSQQSCRYSADTERLAASAERPITVPPGLDRLPVTCRWPANRQPAGRKPGDGAKAERPPNGLRCGRRRTVIAGPRQRGRGAPGPRRQSAPTTAGRRPRAPRPDGHRAWSMALRWLTAWSRFRPGQTHCGAAPAAARRRRSPGLAVTVPAQAPSMPGPKCEECDARCEQA
jgi:hypothetical protein